MKGIRKRQKKRQEKKKNLKIGQTEVKPGTGGSDNFGFMLVDIKVAAINDADDIDAYFNAVVFGVLLCSCLSLVSR